MFDRRSFLRLGTGAVAGTLAAGVLPGLGLAWSDPRWERLRTALNGSLVLPTDWNYDQAKAMVLGQFNNVNPQAVAYCTTPGDVVTCLRFAQDNDIPIAPRSGGHNFAGWSTTPGMIIDLSPMNHVRPHRDSVHLGPGAQAVDVVNQLTPHNLQVVSGLCPTVCTSGYILGGGIGWATRKYGLGSDNLRAAEVVLADGRIVRASEQSERDLFWALRGGGGGNFGIVTNFEVAPVAIPSLVNFNLTWDWEHVLDVIQGYTAWLPEGSESWGSSLVIYLPESTPDAVPQVLIRGAYLGSESDYRVAQDELIAAIGRPPATEDVSDLPYREASMQFYGCEDLSVEECHLVGYNPEAKLPRYNFAVDRGRLANEPLSRSAAHELVAAFDADRRAEQFRYLTFFALGGASNRIPRTATAYVHRDSQYYIGYTVGLHVNTPDPESRQAAQSWADNAFRVSDRYGIPENYINFPDPNLRDWRTAYYGENYGRLTRIKRKYDPYNFFRFGQSIGS